MARQLAANNVIPMPQAFPTLPGDLAAMLRYGRPHQSNACRAFAKRFIGPTGAKRDAFGNYWLRIGDSPAVAWSCHYDTAHHKAGSQRIAYANGVITLMPGDPASCLGADDAAGVWLLLQMIEAKRPGLYLFHNAEEAGGLGSAYIAQYTPELLTGIKAAIALDRRGYGSIITHQIGGRCCSEKFAESLAAQLGPAWFSDDGGTFTDTANYTGLIGECTNLSVGYDHEHSPKETLDLSTLLIVRDRLLSLDVSKLQCSRLPGERELDPLAQYQGDNENGARYVSRYQALTGATTTRTLELLVRDYPDVAADMLEQCGIDAGELYDAIRYAGYHPGRTEYEHDDNDGA